MDSINDILLMAGFSFDGKSGQSDNVIHKYKTELYKLKIPEWFKNGSYKSITGVTQKLHFYNDSSVVVCNIGYESSIIEDENATIRFCYVGYYDDVISLEEFKKLFHMEYTEYRDSRIKQVLK